MTDVLNENVIAEKEVSRKSFIKGGAAIAVGMSVAGSLFNGKAQALTDYGNPNPGHRGTGTLGSNANVDWWLQFNSDGTCTLYDNGTEVGNGTPTGAVMLAAEELEMTAAQFRLAPLDSFNNGNTSARVGSSGTTGLLGTGTSQRTAASGAKNLMLNMAAQKWGVPASTLSVIWGGIKAPDGRKISYFDLMGGRIFGYAQAGGIAPDVKAANPGFTGTIATSGGPTGGIAPTVKNLTSPTAYLPSTPNQVKVVNQRIPRTTIPDIVTGKYSFTQNIRVPGMLHGRVVRPRGQGRVDQAMIVLSIDPTSIAHIPNVQVVREGKGFVGVVAPKEYDAIQAAAQLKVTWDNTPKMGNTVNGKFVGGSTNLAQVMRNSGITSVAPSWTTANAALASSAHTISATFFNQHGQHAPFGPNLAIVDINPKNQTPGGTAWLYNQGGNPASVPQAGGLTGTGADANHFRFISLPGAGTYGHSQYDDAGIAAAFMSKHVGAPVRVQLMRWDETGWDFTGQPALTDIQAGIDTNGKITAFKAAMAMVSSFSAGGEPSADAAGQSTPTTATTGGQAASDMSLGLYTVPAAGKAVRTLGVQRYYRGSYLRAPSEPQQFFVSEQVVDMLAYQAKMDPIAFRKLNIAAASGYPAVLSKVAEISNWKPGVAASNLEKGNIVRGRGVAIGGFAGSLPALVADIEVNKKSGKITVLHVYGVQENGLSLNPASVENQISGCLTQGTSRALHEAAQFNTARSISVDWVTYPILRFKDAPNVTTVTMPTIGTAHGSGEPTTAAMPAVIANAFFDATGVRAFQYPMTSGYIRGVLNYAAKGQTPPPLGVINGGSVTTLS